MGEAKNKLRPILTEEQRMSALSDVSFEHVYDVMYGMCEAVYTACGSISHQLTGIDFKDGEVSVVTAMDIRRKEDVGYLLASMLERWPMVVHTMEAWASPVGDHQPSEHPERQDIVGIMLHTADAIAAAQCPVDPANQTIKKADLVYPDRTEGSMRQFRAPKSAH